MIKRHLLIAVVVGMAILIGLAACTRQISSAPTRPVPTNEIMNDLVLVATQSAIAKGQPGGVSATRPTDVQPANTPEQPITPGEATATSAPEEPTPVPQGPTATLITVPSATPGIPTTWKVQKDETIYCLARRFNVNQNELSQYSGLGGSISPGMTVKIPQSGNPFIGPRALIPHPATYSVDQGDTIYSIACKYGDVSPDAIVFANSLKSPYTLTPGQKLRIP